MADLTVALLKESWVGFEFDSKDFEVRRDKALAWAQACGESDPRFTDPGHPDFQAHPAFTTQFVGGQMFPEGFPRIGNGLGFDAGKCVEAHAPLRPGTRVTARSSIADIYEKTGRSGRMIFIVHRMRFFDEADQLVSVVDWRLVQQPGD